MAKTAKQLVRLLGHHLGELVIASATGAGTATTIVSTNLIAELPNNVAQVNWWAYAATGTVANLTQERRVKSWAADTWTATLHSPGFSAATASSDEFEFHARIPRARKLDALNSAIRQLGLHWYREFVDESVTTATNTLRYTLSSGINWARVHKIELQVSTDGDITGYPYADAQPWNPQIYKTVSAAGVETWYLQFGTQPPADRLVRLYGEAYFSELAADADILGISGVWEGSAIEWILDWATYRLWEREGHRQSSTTGDRYMFWTKDKLQRAKEDLLLNAPTHKSGRILVPGMETGLSIDGFDSSYLGASSGAAFS